MVTDLSVFSDIPDRGGKCQKPRDTESPPQGHRMTNLLSGSHAPATSFPLQQCLVVAGPRGFCVVLARPNLCLACGDRQDKHMVLAAPCSSAHCRSAVIFHWFSTSSVVYPAHLCAKANPCLLQWRERWCRANVVSQVPHQLLQHLWVLTECGTTLSLWVTGCKGTFLWMCEF